MQKTNKIHERSLRLLLKNYKDDFQNFFRSSGDVSIYQTCIIFFICQVFVYQNYIEKVCRSDVNFSPIEITSKKYIEMTRKFDNNPRCIDVMKTSNRRQFEAVYPLCLLYNTYQYGRSKFLNICLLEVIVQWYSGYHYCTISFS